MRCSEPLRLSRWLLPRLRLAATMQPARQPPLSLILVSLGQFHIRTSNMIPRFVVPLFLYLFAVTGFAAEPPFDRARLLGTWEFQVSGSLRSFAGYTTYRPDGTCVQIGRGKTLGMTKWIYVETQWRLEGDQVVASVTRSSIGLPIGKTTTSRIIRLTASEFTYREAGDGADRTEHRVAQVPPDFQRQLEELEQKATRK